MTLDRVNNNGNYEPGNMRWATYREQENNKRSNLRLLYDGRILTGAEYARATGLSVDCVYRKIAREKGAAR